MLVQVYSDGSATTADKPGGWAFVVVVDGTELTRSNGGLPSATNNVAEITAAIEGLKWVNVAQNNGAIPCKANVQIELISDSQLVLKYATGEYKCRKMHLVPLYLELRKQFQALGASTRWVKGHNGDEYNEICDQLAKAGRESMEK